jgi:Ca2+/Na+ antiporter
MNWLARGIFQPVTNRHYMGERLHRIRFMFGFIPITLICLVVFVMTLNILWLLGLVLVLTYGVVVYYTFDKARDKFLWNKLYKRHFESPKTPAGYKEIKAYEANPSQENKANLEKTLKEE